MRMGIPLNKPSRPVTSDTTGEEHSLKLDASTASIIGGGEYKDGRIEKWKSTSTRITWEVNFKNAGRIDLYISLANNRLNAGAIIRIMIGSSKSSGKTFFSGGWDKFELMSMNFLFVSKPGIYTVTLQVADMNNLSVGHFSYLLLSGPGVEDANEIAITPTTGYLGLMWQGGEKSNWIYNEVRVNTDETGTAYVACSFNDGQFILLSNVEDGEKFVSFVVYSVDCDQQDNSNVTKHVLPTLVKKQKRVVSGVSREYSGHYSHFKYDWAIKQTYHFLIKAETTKITIQYTAFFYLNESKKWKKIAVYRVRRSLLQGVMGLNCRVQTFCERSGRFTREVVFGPAWCKKSGDDWFQVNKFSFLSQDENPRAIVSTTEGAKRVVITAWGQIVKGVATDAQFVCKDSKLPAILEVLPE